MLFNGHPFRILCAIFKHRSLHKPLLQLYLQTGGLRSFILFLFLILHKILTFFLDLKN